MRLDSFLVENNFYKSRNKAAEGIDRGEVCVNGKVCEKASTQVDSNDEVTLRREEIPFVSLGGDKLNKAVKYFLPEIQGKQFIDVGASTGGFTEYALSQGAKKVIAVEKGTNQMKSPLRDNPKVELHEKTDIFDFVCEPDVVLADVSFISLTKILKYAKDNLANKNTEFLVMLKPQFEANPKDLTDGIVKNETVRRGLIKKFEQWLKFNGFIIINKHDNEQKGKHGNRERFYYLRLAK